MGYFNNFLNNCTLNPAIPAVLGTTFAASIYVPLKYMPVKNVALALNAVSTLDKVKAVAWILGCAYVCMSAFTMTSIVLCQPKNKTDEDIKDYGLIKQTVKIFVGQFLSPFALFYHGIPTIHDSE